MLILDEAATAACACPHCSRVLRVTLDFAGRPARCRNCRRAFHVPDREELVDFAAAELINQGVADEFHARRERSERRVRQASRGAFRREVLDPFAETGGR